MLKRGIIFGKNNFLVISKTDLGVKNLMVNIYKDFNIIIFYLIQDPIYR